MDSLNNTFSSSNLQPSMTALLPPAISTPISTLLAKATPFNVILTAFVVVLSLAFYQLYLYPFHLSPLRHLPSPPHGHWLLGQLPAIIGSDSGSIQAEWNEKYGQDGLIRVVGPFGLERIVPTRPQALSYVLQKKPYQYPKPSYAAKILGLTAGEGLLTLENNDHKSLRRFLNPAFGTKYLVAQSEQHYYPAINNLIDEFKKQISESGANEKVIDLYAWGGRCLLDIISAAAFGLEVDSVRNVDAPLSVAYHNLVNTQNGSNLASLVLLVSMPLGKTIIEFLSSSSSAGPFFMKMSQKIKVDFFSRQLAIFGTFCSSMYTIREIATNLLKEKLAEAQKLKAAGADVENSGRIDILSLLVKSSIGESSPYRMDAKMMQAQVLTFLAAGHETTASGITWTLWLLVQHPEVQEKLRKEVLELLAINRYPDFQQVKSLKYLDAVIHESLRVRPPVPATMRRAEQNDVIAGQFVPRGTFVYINSRTINTDIHVWGDDAAEFKPERWFDLPKDYDSTFSLMTFLSGPHHCIGRSMAISEMKFLILSLIGNFRFDYSEPNQQVIPDSAITMKPRDGLPLKVSLV